MRARVHGSLRIDLERARVPQPFVAVLEAHSFTASRRRAEQAPDQLAIGQPGIVQPDLDLVHAGALAWRGRFN
jgi:hypothetical protein